MWIHGGFTAYYPYPSSSSAGSAEGSKAKRATGFMPFESESFFLDDLWFYDFSKGIWKELKPGEFYLNLDLDILLIIALII